MKASSTTINVTIGSAWSISIILAACSITAVTAWSAAIRYSSKTRSPSVLCTSYQWFMKRQRQYSKGEALRTRYLQSSSSKDECDHKDDEDIEISNSTNITPRQSRFTTIEDTMNANGGSLNVRPIGTIRSVYRLCVGTPRQGMLAPHARARIELHNIDDDRTGVAAAASVDGLQSYSHIWIVFIFHLNTVGKRRHSKIAPPALGGSKVGVLATRSPHRLNPIGITLAKLDGIRTIPTSRTTTGRKQGAITVLEISGSDLVDGTPVLDIKPYVPTYDAVPSDVCTVPDWVADGLSTARPVQFTESAENELHNIVWNHSNSLEFYGNDSSLTNDTVYDSIKACIEEILATDVRSRHQTNKARLGLSRAEKADRIQQQNQRNESTGIPTMKAVNDYECTQQIDNLLVSFTVTEAERKERRESIGSGAEDIVIVRSIHLIDVL
jgi:tRNA (adenine37-N6)-methyltransferase